MIPYGRQWLDADDEQEVLAALRSGWLTTGPRVEEFERSVTSFTGAVHGVAVSSGTAALHTAMFALGIGPGDEVVVPPMTFAATANAVLYMGGTPVFADVDPATLLLDPAAAEARITPRTKAIVGVDYAGQPCDWDALRAVADRHGLALVADGCHALGAEDRGRKVGVLADMTVFSFHPVKHVTTGEGGMVVTGDTALAARCRLFRNHGITTDAAQRERAGAWFYEMTELGYNYRITDIQCALGLSQMSKLSGFLGRRRGIARNTTRPCGERRYPAPALREGALHTYQLCGPRGRARQRLRRTSGPRGSWPTSTTSPCTCTRTTGSASARTGLCPHAEAAYASC
jgi:perosamine synthetase